MKTTVKPMSNSNIISVLNANDELGFKIVNVRRINGDMSGIGEKSIVVKTTLDEETKSIYFDIVNSVINEDLIDMKTLLKYSDLDVVYDEYTNKLSGDIEISELNVSDFDMDNDDSVTLTSNIEEDYSKIDIDEVFRIQIYNAFICKLYRVICERLYQIENEALLETQKQIDNLF